MARKKKTLKVWRDIWSGLNWTWGEVWLSEEDDEAIDVGFAHLWCALPPHVVELLDWLDYIPTEPYYLEIE